MTEHQLVSSLIVKTNDYTFFHPLKIIFLNMYRKYIFLITFDRHDISKFLMNLEFLIFINITFQFQLYLDFSCHSSPLSQYWSFDWRFGMVHVINYPFTTNIIQQSLIFSIKVFRSWFFYFFRIFLNVFL